MDYRRDSNRMPMLAHYTTSQRRTLSNTRAPTHFQSANVSNLIRTYNSGSSNISTSSGYQNLPSINNRTSYSNARSYHSPSSHDRLFSTGSYSSNMADSNSSNETNVTQRVSRPTATFYSIRSPVSVDDTEREKTSPRRKTNDRFSEDRSLSMNTEELWGGGLVGLRNLGNTCFMNSVLQCLSNTKPLLLYCLQNNLANQLNASNTSVMKGDLMRAYANLVRKMWLSSDCYSAISPSDFKNTIGKFAPRFTGYSEQDSQEFLRYLLQGLHEDVNRVQQKPTPIVVDETKEEKMRESDRAKASWNRCLRYDNSRLVEIFAGQLKSTLECSYCQYQSITFDMFWDLSIPLPRDKSLTTVQECLQLFMSKEELSGDEKPTCARCKQKRPCTKKFSIQKCPEILVLHLKRFSQSRGRSKLNTSVEFPLENLQLSNLVDVMSASHEETVTKYSLFGISNHSGTLYSGHYTAQCKHPFTRKWHEFNDSSVYTLNNDVESCSDNAYVLFYEKNK